MKYILFVFSIMLSLFFYSCENKITNEEVVYETENGEKWVRTYFKNQRLIVREGMYKDTIPVGLIRGYTKNGILRYEENHNLKGQVNGIVRHYYGDNFEKNFLKEEGIVYNNIPIGTWKLFRENGELELILKSDSTGCIYYYVKFDEDGYFIKDSSGSFGCEVKNLK